MAISEFVLGALDHLSADCLPKTCVNMAPSLVPPTLTTSIRQLDHTANVSEDSRKSLATDGTSEVGSSMFSGIICGGYAGGVLNPVLNASIEMRMIVHFWINLANSLERDRGRML